MGLKPLLRTIGGFAVQVDVANAVSVQNLADLALEKLGHIDILVNNAGITHLPQALEEVSEDEFDHVLAVNAKSVYLTARSFVPHFKSRKSGAILNIASTAGVSPRPPVELVQCFERLDDHRYQKPWQSNLLPMAYV